MLLHTKWRRLICAIVKTLLHCLNIKHTILSIKLIRSWVLFSLWYMDYDYVVISLQSHQYLSHYTLSPDYNVTTMTAKHVIASKSLYKKFFVFLTESLLCSAALYRFLQMCLYSSSKTTDLKNWRGMCPLSLNGYNAPGQNQGSRRKVHFIGEHVSTCWSPADIIW